MNYSINNSIRKQQMSEMGVNVLTGKIPVVRDAKGREFEPMWGKGLKFITSDTIYQHVDFLAEMPFTVTFDMEETVSFDRALIASFYSPNADYCLEDFKIYCGNVEQELYDDANCIGEYNNKGVYSKQNREGSIVCFDYNEENSARFFGLKVFASNPTDAIARIAKIAVFSKSYERQRTYLNKYGLNLCEGLEPEFIDETGKSICIWPNYGKISYINDGVAFQSDRVAGFTFKRPVDAVYRFKKKFDVDKLVIAYKGTLPEIELYLSDEVKTLYDNKQDYTVTSETVDGSQVAVYSFPANSCNCMAVRFLYSGEEKRCELSELGAYSSAFTVDASSGAVINDKFIGNGENIVPFSLQPGNIKAGYNDELYASDCNRVIKIKPSLIRFWMQVDWFEKQKGVYDFDTPEMQAVWRYFDLFKQSGSEVQLTHSWKVGPEAQEWFSIPGVDEPRNSAPVDLEHYAEGFSVLMQEIWRRGYDNVCHVSFANEPGYSWDFLCHGNRKAYYCDMVRAVDKKFREDGIREKTVFWCCESAESMEWMEYCYDHIDDCVDYYTLHCYECPEDELDEKMMKKVRELKMQPFLMTECSENGADMCNPWNRSLAGLLIESSNLGGGGIVMWTIHGIKSMSIWSPDSWTMNESGHMWNTQLLGGMPNLNYYNMSLFTRYLPARSKVLNTDVIGDGMRAATYLTPDGDTTVIIECKRSSAQRTLNVKLPVGVNRVEKHVYVPAQIKPTFDAIVPPVERVIECDGQFTDTEIPNDYCVIVYTTMPAQVQVALADDHIKLKAGESYKFDARVIDGNCDVVFSTLNGKGKITNDGLFTASGLEAGDTVAVLATPTADECGQGLAIIDII